MSTHAISTEGLALIRDYEGFRASPAQLPDGNWVVGHGHVRIGDAGADVTEAEAADLLALDLAPVERSVSTLVKAELTQSQFDALVSFAFSVGAEAFEHSQVLRRANGGLHVQAACAMDAWRKSDVGGELEVVDALVRRRAAEKALYLKGTPHDAAPSVFMRAKLDHAASILGAPVKYAPAPVVGSIAVAKPAPVAAERLAEILKSEPATEALLLTRIAPEPEAEEEEVAEEINTAHAKPVARSLEEGRRALWRAEQEKRAAAAERAANRFNFRLRGKLETFGLFGLLFFGFALLSMGATGIFRGHADLVDVMGALAFVGPGILAVGISAYGLWRGPAIRVPAAA